MAGEFAEDDEHDGDCDDTDLLVQAEEWVDINMAYAYLGPDAPVIVATADSL
jgi:hypothetical protein